MSNKDQKIKSKLLALRRALDETLGELETEEKSKVTSPRVRRNHKEGRKIDMAANFQKYNKK